jgi:type I restriction enzyme S subunit
MNSSNKLKDVAVFSTEKIDAEKISQVNFVSVDNLNPNKQGVCEATFQPKGSLVHFKKGDILVGNIRPYLKKIWLADKDGGCSPDVLVFKARPKTDNSFLYYSLFRDEFFEHMMTGSKGTKMPRGDKNQILQFEIPQFELEYQQKIASVLSALDAKIELNNKINAELEAMAKTLYDYWFVQFDFPNKNGKPYKSSGGKMVWNEELKREIPEGWEVKSLEEIENNIITGKTPSTQNHDYFNGDIPFICIGDVRGNMHIVKTEITLTDEGAATQLNKYIPKGAICVTCIASPGLVGFATKDSQTNQQLNSIVCKSPENRYYLYFYLIDYFKYSSAKTGNTFANMNKGDFSSIRVIKPAREVLLAYTDVIQPSVEKVLNNSLENQQLATLRDWLLPMLMNGQVKVDGVYGQTEETTEHLMVAEPKVTYGRKD